MLMSQNSIP